MVKSKFQLADAATYRKVKEWFDSGRGVLMWTNKDLSNPSAPEMITPGDAEKAPHWAYVGQPETLTPEDIEVCIESRIALPPEWYPECEYCKGKGTRSVSEIAAIRGVSSAETKAGLVSGGRTEWIDDENFKCFSCNGSGHTVKAPEFRVKRLPPYRGGGFEVSDAGKKACNKLAVRLAKYYRIEPFTNHPKSMDAVQGHPTVLWSWQHWDNGMARAYFYTEVVKPFTEFTE